MQVQMTTAEMMRAFGALTHLSHNKLPVKGSYTIARLLSKLKPEFEVAEAKRGELVQELGEQQEDGTSVVRPGTEAMKTFTERFRPVGETVLEMDLPLLSIEHLGDLNVEPVVLRDLEKLLTE